MTARPTSLSYFPYTPRWAVAVFVNLRTCQDEFQVSNPSNPYCPCYCSSTHSHMCKPLQLDLGKVTVPWFTSLQHINTSTLEGDYSSILLLPAQQPREIGICHAIACGCYDASLDTSTWGSDIDFRCILKYWPLFSDSFSVSQKVETEQQIIWTYMARMPLNLNIMRIRLLVGTMIQFRPDLGQVHGQTDSIEARGHGTKKLGHLKWSLHSHIIVPKLEIWGRFRWI